MTHEPPRWQVCASQGAQSIVRSALLCIIAAMLACATSPLGRRQVVVYSDAQVDRMGDAAFQSLLNERPLAHAPAEERYVRCVARQLLSVTPEAGDASSWQIEIFADESANAFALPGGNIGVNTGMLELTEDPSQLATVLAHEIAHVIAKHSNERLSTTSLTRTALGVVQILVGSQTPEQHELMALLGLGAQFGVLLPFSRTQETEADLIGLQIMARAGFDPRESVTLWQNMERASEAGPPEFLSTHPASGTRIARLRKAMPRALEIYQSSDRRPSCRPPQRFPER